MHTPLFAAKFYESAAGWLHHLSNTEFFGVAASALIIAAIAYREVSESRRNAMQKDCQVLKTSSRKGNLSNGF